MKFFLECVSCCTPAVKTTSSTPTPAPAPEPEQENRALVRFKKREKQLRGRRWRSGTTTPVAAQSWKPSLCAITEDRVVSVVSVRNNRERSSGSDHENKRPRKVVGSRARNPVADHGGEHDFRHTGVPMVIPAFSPMAIFY